MNLQPGKRKKGDAKGTQLDCDMEIRLRSFFV
jgi:hypothetical protein